MHWFQHSFGIIQKYFWLEKKVFFWLLTPKYLNISCYWIGPKIMISKISLNKNTRIPLYLQIKNQIKEMILSEIVPEGKSLPPTRELAKALGVNRSTVVSAYNELVSDGFVKTYHKKGTVVVGKNPEKGKTNIQQVLWQDYFSVSQSKMDISFLRDTITFTKHPVTQSSETRIISFAAGYPSPDSFPVKIFQNIINELLNSKKKSEVFSQSACQGYFPLRELLSQQMTLAGHSLSPDEVAIVSGSLQGLYILTQILVDPGDIVIVERPTFLRALQIFKAVGAKIIGIPIDENGMRIDILENLISRQKPKLIYILPTFQNPTGVVLSLERRKKLLDLAHKYQIGVIEDDPYRNVYFENPPSLSLKSLDKNNNIIYLSTFSKTIFPGLRIGWIIAPKQVIKRIIQMKYLLDIHSNTLSEFAFYEFCRRGLFLTHLEKIKKIYRKNRDIMISALENYGKGLKIWQKPEGGFYTWCNLEGGLNSEELLKEALNKKVAFIPGVPFFPSESEGKNWIRLNFTYEKQELIEEGIKRMSSAVEKLIKRNKKAKKGEKFEIQPII